MCWQSLSSSSRLTTAAGDQILNSIAQVKTGNQSDKYCISASNSSYTSVTCRRCTDSTQHSAFRSFANRHRQASRSQSADPKANSKRRSTCSLQPVTKADSERTTASNIRCFLVNTVWFQCCMPGKTRTRWKITELNNQHREAGETVRDRQL